MPGPYYFSPRDFGRTQATAAAAITRANELLADQDPMGSWRAAFAVLCGVSERDDLTPEDVDALLAVGDSPPQQVCLALLTNPAVSGHPTLKSLVTPGVVASLVRSGHAARYTDEILDLLGYRVRADVGISGAEVAEALGVEAVEDYFARVLMDHVHERLVTVAGHPLLPARSFTALCDLVRAVGKPRADSPADSPAESSGDPDDELSMAERIYEQLCHRDDLTDAQSLSLCDLGMLLARANRSRGRWVLTALIFNSRAPAAAMNRLVTHPARSIRDLVLAGPHVKAETVHVALRTHQPHAIMILAQTHKQGTLRRGGLLVDDNAAFAALADLEAGVARRVRLSSEDVIRYAGGLLRCSPSPQVWDRVLRLYQRHHADADTSAAQAFFDHRIGRGDRFDHEFLRWASGHDDDALRAATIPDLVWQEQVLAAASDPSPLVRCAVAAHPLAGHQVWALLADDPDPTVRAEIAERLLTALA